MRWIFGIVGLLLGGLSGGVIGAFFGALIGLGLASLILYMDKRASAQWANPPDVPGATSAAPGHAATQAAVSPPPATLQERVARLVFGSWARLAKSNRLGAARERAAQPGAGAPRGAAAATG